MPSVVGGACVQQPEHESTGGLQAEIIAIGTELLLGDNVDTNSAWLSRRLTEFGVDVRRHTVVGDDIGQMTAAMRRASADHSVVVVTGGLGPTQDDLTRFAVAAVAGVELERRDDLVEGIRRYFAVRGRGMPERNLVQADLPAGAQVIPPVGTAPGFAIEIGAALMICLPGVPREMQAMTDHDVLPLLQLRGGLLATVSRSIRTAGMSESDVAEICAGVVDRLEHVGNPQIAFLASRAETRISVTGRARDRDQAQALVDPVISELADLLGKGVAGLDDEGVEHAVARQMRARGWTLSVAESITGGGVGARLVIVPGASGWFAGGVTVYATAAKPLLAGVPDALLAEDGPVSEDVACALAQGVRERLHTDVGLGVVGVAGPTSQGDRPVGTVCLGLAWGDSARASTTVMLPPRSRQDMQEFAASVALDFLRRRLATMSD